MTEDRIREIVREEIAKAGPIIMARTAMWMQPGKARRSLGYRSYAMVDGKETDVTFVDTSARARP